MWHIDNIDHRNRNQQEIAYKHQQLSDEEHVVERRHDPATQTFTRT